MSFSSIEAAIEDLRQGKVVIVADDEDRENEGDFIVAAETCTPEVMNFIIKYGRGMPCVPTTAKRLEELQIPMMVGTNTARLGTAMTVTVDALHGTTTGISAYDRAKTVAGVCRPQRPPGRPGASRPYHSAAGGGRGRLAPRRAYGSDRRSGRLAGFQPTRRVVRNRGRRRHDGADARTGSASRSSST